MFMFYASAEETNLEIISATQFSSRQARQETIQEI